MSHIERINQHIWIQHAEHETDRPLLAAIVGERRTLLLDAGNSPAHAAQFRSKLQQNQIPLPEMMVLTHWHWDHTFGMSEWKIPAIANRRTATRLSQLSGLSWTDESLNELIHLGVINETTARHIQLEYSDNRDITIMEPDLLFDSKLTLDLGGVVCELEHIGGDHAEDSCLLFVREDKTIFLGDALGPRIYGGPYRYSSGIFLQLMERILGYSAQTYVESHARPVSASDFHEDISRYVQLARYVDSFGGDEKRITEAMKQYLQVEELPNEFTKAITWFLTS
ncbi:MBL fold metallo-hydrolase [Bacillus sp. 3255]|uniref:MBL fold metallo-hydrolase n=1 Tax=Bacillus sp. 3255 TaxID=2817904 RepID=UPI002854580D|nr:MBL fold metallo-hydrolase [Bacillus sp. 3255]MDR6879341.1 glyoxylase-like metal-dependent hydrolase (beta-lactamase superfamily II) [Bacillus sp. 3255]